MAFTPFSPTAFAEEANDLTITPVVCENYKVHDEKCKYIEAKEAQPYSHQNENGSFSCPPNTESEMDREPSDTTNLENSDTAPFTEELKEEIVC